MNKSQREEPQPQPFSIPAAIKRYLAPTQVQQVFPKHRRWKFLTPLILLALAGLFPAWMVFIPSIAKVDFFSYVFMSLGLIFPLFSLIYGYFWADFWHQKGADKYASTCANCGQKWPGANARFYYGTKTGQQTSKRRYMNTVRTYTTTSYHIAGTEIHYICDVCAKAHRLKDLRNFAYQVLIGILIPVVVGMILVFFKPGNLAGDLRWVSDGLTILLILSVLGGIIAVIQGIEMIGRIAVTAMRKKHTLFHLSGQVKVPRFEASLLGSSESTSLTALDYDRDNIAIDMRRHDLGRDYIYWIRETYARLRPEMF